MRGGGRPAGRRAPRVADTHEVGERWRPCRGRRALAGADGVQLRVGQGRQPGRPIGDLTRHLAHRHSGRSCDAARWRSCGPGWALVRSRCTGGGPNRRPRPHRARASSRAGRLAPGRIHVEASRCSAPTSLSGCPRRGAGPAPGHLQLPPAEQPGQGGRRRRRLQLEKACVGSAVFGERRRRLGPNQRPSRSTDRRAGRRDVGPGRAGDHHAQCDLRCRLAAPTGFEPVPPP